MMHDPARADLSRILQNLDSPERIIVDPQEKAFKSDIGHVPLRMLLRITVEATSVEALCTLATGYP